MEYEYSVPALRCCSVWSELEFLRSRDSDKTASRSDAAANDGRHISEDRRSVRLLYGHRRTPRRHVRLLKNGSPAQMRMRSEARGYCCRGSSSANHSGQPVKP